MTEEAEKVEEITVAIEEEKPEKSDKPEKDADAVEQLAEQVETFKKQAEEARRAQEEESRRFRESEAEAKKYKKDIEDSRKQSLDRDLEAVNASMSAAQSEAESAEGEYARAMEQQDYGAAAKAQRKIASAEAKLIQLKEAATLIETKKAEKPEPPKEEAIDPVEAYIRGAPNAPRSQRAQSWLREHKDYITDTGKNASLSRAHFAALGEGIAPDTQDYFDFVEKKLGLKEADKKEESKRRGSPPVAPGGNGGTAPMQVKLTKAEAQAATDGTLTWNYNDPSGKGKFKKGDPIGVQEFARRKAKMHEQGFYDKSYTEQ